jgi:hypothetical protein
MNEEEAEQSYDLARRYINLQIKFNLFFMRLFWFCCGFIACLALFTVFTVFSTFGVIS